MPPSTNTFTASYDRFTAVISAIVCLAPVLIGLLTHNTLAPALLIALILLTYLWSPRSYSVSAEWITVNRLVGGRRIPLTQVRELRRATPEDLSGAIRLWASGALFGYFGVFRTAKLGACRWYVTNRRNTVLVATDAGATLFSPDDVDGFLASVRPWVPFASSVPIPASPAAKPARPALRWFAVAAVAGVIGAVAALAAFAITYSPGPPAYTLTPNSLTIHDRFYPVTLPAASVDTSGVRVVDLDTNPAWRPVARTNGFANSHYRSGWFRVVNGETVRLYQAGSRRLVLLPSNGTGPTVLLEVRAPDAFVAELRRAWNTQATERARRALSPCTTSGASEISTTAITNLSKFRRTNAMSPSV
jgi:hypothetical protein